MLRRSLCGSWAIALSLATYLTGCFPMEVTSLEAPSGLEKLIAVSDSNLPVSIDTRGYQNRSLGHQYLLMALPITRIYLPSLESDTAMQLSVACGMRGYRCSTNPSNASDPSNARQPTLAITVTDVSINGYDLLFVRKPTASVTLAGEVRKGGEVVRSCEESSSATNTAHYAFNAELQHALGEALLQASYKLLDCLGLTSAR